MANRSQTLLRALVLFGFAGLGLGAYLWLTHSAEGPRARQSRERGQPVRVIVVAETAAVPRVTGYGEVEAARSWQGIAEVGGTVIELSADVQVGRVIREGELLFEIDPGEAELEKQRTVASVKGVRAQIGEIKAREASARASLEVEQRVLALAKKEQERTQSLYRQGSASLSEAESAEATVLTAEKAVVALKNTLAELPASRRTLEAQLEVVNAGVTGAELVLARTRVVAPFTMRISELHVTTGQSVAGGQILVVGEGLDVLEVTARLPIGGIDPLLPARPQRRTPAPEPEPSEPEPESPTAAPIRGGWFDRIAEVVTATVRLRMAGVDASWPARFSRIAGVDPLTRTTVVVVELDREQRRLGSSAVRLTSGMHVSVEFVGAPRPGCLALPIAAVHDGVVYVVGERDRLERRAVEIDWAQAEFVCVGAGLAAGEQVVISDLVPAVEGMRIAPTVDNYETERLAELTGAQEQAS